MVNSYCTTDMVEAELRLETEFDVDTYPSLESVERWITEESKIVELKCGSVFGSTLASSSVFDYDGESIFRLPYSPLISVSKVEYNENDVSDSPSWIELEEGYGKNYLVYLDEGEIEFISGISATNKITPRSGKKRLRITFTYGNVSTPLEIQRLVTLLVSKRVIMSLASSQSNTEGGSIQVGTIRVSDPSNYSVNYLKSMNDEVKDLLASIGQGFKVYRPMRVYD
jgi:hypothetical protein